MKNINPNLLPDLDVCVLNALGLFANPKTKLPEINFDAFERPLVVGSGNAAATGRIMFADKDAVFADESTYESRLDAVPSIDGVMLLSASAGKHAPIIAKNVRSRGLRVVLFTCNPHASDEPDFDEVHVFPSLPEPYTYNTSTYMGMILAKTQENPRRILSHIKRAVNPALKNSSIDFANFNAFFILVPEEFDLIRPMLNTKFVELFARRVARDIFTWEQAKHATRVVEADAELFISFGKQNEWGKYRLHIPLPKKADYATMMAVGYYVIGKIQAQKLPWFKESIQRYCDNPPTISGKKKTKYPVIVKYG